FVYKQVLLGQGHNDSPEIAIHTVGRAELMRDQISATDTIFALSSGTLPSGVAVIRISGPQSAEVLQRLTGKTLLPRRAAFTALRDLDGELIDKGISIFF